MKTVKFTVPDIYGRVWDGIMPYIAHIDHISAKELDTAPIMKIGGRVWMRDVQCVKESAIADEHGTYSYFTAIYMGELS